mgnify:FL=1
MTDLPLPSQPALPLAPPEAPKPSPLARLRRALRMDRPHVAVVRLQGAIGARGPLSDQAVAPLLEAAFGRRPVAVALEVNSPGGSPVQSSLIAARIRRLSEDKKVPVTAFVEDVAASGGYWIAAAADDIVVDRASLVGSIGVIAAGFGFQGAIARWGIERRVHTAGRSKSLLDPFRPESPEDVARLDAWLNQLHDTFIDHVLARRGARLKSDPNLFSGDVWIGDKAVDRGLADAVGHLVPTMKARHGAAIRFRRLGRRRPLLARLGLGAAAEEAVALAEERLLMARWGL